ncbi:MAG: adenine nucleotide alpha hydrolase [Thaumarchaeota archaeon]|nr:adenine nucleotide alpha hydrolase [Nitrososphaerota archaeon]
MAKSVLMSWSGGKDSALALQEVVGTGGCKVKAMLTTVTAEFERISMHGVRRTLLHAQASSLGLPIEEVRIPKNASNETYEEQMKAVLLRHKNEGVEDVVFGDLFLRDIRGYREDRLGQIGMHGLFPLWGRDTSELAIEFNERGFKAVVCCIDPRRLGKEFCGREFDRSFLESLPSGVDPCGENGEFHTFVYAGPIFKNDIAIAKGEVVLRDGYYFVDLLPRDR